jgi:hypothetical protein
MRKRFFIPFLALWLGVAGCANWPEPVDSASLSEEGRGIAENAATFYQLLMQKDIASRHTRPDLEPFFESPSDTSLYIADLLWQMREEGLQNRRLLDYRVTEVEFFSEGKEAETIVALRGRYYVFTWRTFWRKDRWIHVGNRWFLKPYPQIGRSIVEP